VIAGITMALLLIGTMLSVLPTRGQFVGQIKIGVIGPVGLPHWSPAGMKEASEMAADEINAAGGVHLADGDYEVVLVFGDEKAYPTPDPAGAALEMERLISVEGCEFIMGGFRSEVTGAMIEVAMDYETPFFINGAFTDELISGTVAVNYERYKYLFRVNPVNSDILIHNIAGAAQTILATKLLPFFGHDLGGPNPQVKVAVIMEDLAWTETMYFYLTHPAVYPAVLGPYANVTYAGRIPDGATDCSPWLMDVIASEASLLIHIFSGVTGVPFIMQWGAMNVQALPLGINVMAQLQTHWDTTGGACEYEGILDFVGTRTPIIPGVTEVFWDNFVGRTGVWPIYTAFGAYNGMCFLAEALEATGTKDKDALVAHLEDPAYETTGLTGKFKYTQYHDVYSTEFGPFWTEGYMRPMVVQWLAGRMEVVFPIDQVYTKKWAIPPWIYPLTTDVNYDGKVNILDISAAARAFGTTPGDMRWDKECDVNFDDYVNILDISYVAMDFGMTYTSGDYVCGKKCEPIFEWAKDTDDDGVPDTKWEHAGAGSTFQPTPNTFVRVRVDVGPCCSVTEIKLFEKDWSVFRKDDDCGTVNNGEPFRVIARMMDPPDPGEHTEWYAIAKCKCEDGKEITKKSYGLVYVNKGVVKAKVTIKEKTTEIGGGLKAHAPLGKGDITIQAKSETQTITIVDFVPTYLDPDIEVTLVLLSPLPSGWSLSVDPSSFSLAPGEYRSADLVIFAPTPGEVAFQVRSDCSGFVDETDPLLLVAVETSVSSVSASGDKFGLLASYIGLNSRIAVAIVATAISVKRVERIREKQ